MTHEFEITEASPGFERLSEWWVSYGDSKVTWRPVAPFLFPSDDHGEEIVAEAQKHLQWKLRNHEDSRWIDGGTPAFIAAHPNVCLPLTLSNPHTALLMLDRARAFDPSEDFFDEDEEGYTGVEVGTEQEAVTFSANAPQLIDIFGPSHDEDGNQIIY